MCMCVCKLTAVIWKPFFNFKESEKNSNLSLINSTMWEICFLSKCALEKEKKSKSLKLPVDVLCP